MQTLRKLRDLLSPREQRQALLVFAMMVVAAFMEVVGVASVMPFITVLTDTSVVQTNPVLSAVFTALGFGDTRGFLLFLGATLLVVFLSSLGFRAITLYAIQRFATMRLHSIAVRLLTVYLAQPYEFMLNKNSASLAKSILTEVANVANGVLLPGMRAISGAIVSLAIVVLLVVVHPLMSVILAGGLGLSYLIIYTATRPLFTRAGKARLKANDERFVLAGEALQGLKELRVLGREADYLDRFNAPSKEFARRQAQTLIVRELPYFLVQSIAFGGVLGLLLYLVARGEQLATILPLIAFYTFAGYRILPAFQDIYRSLGLLKFSLPALDELHADFARRAFNVPASTTQMPPLPLKSSIVFDHVGFRYSSARGAAIRDLSLEIKAGSSVAFVGQTGAGKSTVADLLLGLLTPGEGRILIDGTPLTEDNMRTWQANIGYVPQSIFLADDTVAANIAFGTPPGQIDMQAVERAARQAHIHEFIVSELADGYRTRIGERGARISGGQRQRLGIARALYSDPQVVMFDEATSALDNRTEAQVMEAFTALHGEKTVIMIAHRLSTVQECDTIFHLESGRLIQEGTFRQLLEYTSFREFVHSDDGHDTSRSRARLSGMGSAPNEF